MTQAAGQGEAGHAQLMDSVYRWQRHTYDFTRKYYLFGRDRVIQALDLGNGGSVLEIGCGTGRNLAMVRRAWPQATLFGIDISAQMLKTAQARLGPAAGLAAGDASSFDPRSLFGHGQFDRIIMSYCTSMIPEWGKAVGHAGTMLAHGGSLHIVDFGDMARLPAPVRAMLRGWLARFHVTPRHALAGDARSIGASCGLLTTAETGPGHYYQIVRMARPA